MNKKPILFNRDMVLSLLSGHKTVTRRPVPSWQEPINQRDGSGYFSIAQKHPRWGFGLSGETADEVMAQYKKYQETCPYGVPGQRLYVREALQQTASGLLYKADSQPVSDLARISWRYRGEGYIGGIPSIHMPRWASRLELNVEQAYVEKLRDITEEEALKEGFESKSTFCALWESMYPDAGENPFVWVVRFSVVRKGGAG